MTPPVYAKPDDLAEFLGDNDPPDNADRLLQQASRLVDTLLIGARYRVDSDDKPQDSAVADALLDATVTQAAFWSKNGDPIMGSGEGQGAYDSVSIGSVSLSRGSAEASGTVDGMQVAPGVAAALQLAGLLPVYARRVG